jgi:hypothetical protein
MARQAITADCFWSAGYLATSRAREARSGWLRKLNRCSSVDLAEHDVHGADDRHASAIMWPRAISSSAARCAKPGARIFSR